MTRGARRIVLWVIAVVIFAVTTWPPSTFVGHSHWDQVEWIPFSHGLHPLDLIANVLLFTPFGAVFAWGRRRSAITRAVLAGALLSLAIETYQVYCHGHFPTMTDVVTNLTGTWLAARLAWRTSAAAAPRSRRSQAEARVGSPRRV